jgi:hypothetical protein
MTTNSHIPSVSNQVRMYLHVKDRLFRFIHMLQLRVKDINREWNIGKEMRYIEDMVKFYHSFMVLTALPRTSYYNWSGAKSSQPIFAMGKFDIGAHIFLAGYRAVFNSLPTRSN